MQNRGFTLIEFVVAIVILGVLAVTAVPHFLNISSDARSASIHKLTSAIASGAALVQGKATIAGLDDGIQELDMGNGESMSIRNAFPRVGNSCSRFVGDFKFWLDIDITTSCSTGGDNTWTGETRSNQFIFFPPGYRLLTEGCYVSYESAAQFQGNRVWTETDSYTLTYDISGC